METQRRERAKQSWIKTRRVGQTAWRPYAPTGAMRLDDDNELPASTEQHILRLGRMGSETVLTTPCI